MQGEGRPSVAAAGNWAAAAVATTIGCICRRLTLCAARGLAQQC